MHQPWASLLVIGVKLHEGRIFLMTVFSHWFDLFNYPRNQETSFKSLGRHQDIKCKPFEVIKESEINWTETYHDIKCITYLHCFLKGRNAQVSFAENQQMKINSLNKQKHEYLINTWSNNFLRYHCKSSIAIFALRVPLNYAFNRGRKYLIRKLMN